MALGAEPRAVLGLILRQAFAVTGLGIGVGLAGAVGLSRYLSALLFGLSHLLIRPPTCSWPLASRQWQSWRRISQHGAQCTSILLSRSDATDVSSRSVVRTSASCCQASTYEPVADGGESHRIEESEASRRPSDPSVAYHVVLQPTIPDFSYTLGF
jgi:ABC-type antimicrobial peptide transport system permease subunit